MQQMFRFRMSYLDGRGDVQVIDWKTTDALARERCADEGWLRRLIELFAADGLTVLNVERIEQVAVSSPALPVLDALNLNGPGGIFLGGPRQESTPPGDVNMLTN